MPIENYDSTGNEEEDDDDKKGNIIMHFFRKQQQPQAQHQQQVDQESSAATRSAHDDNQELDPYTIAPSCSSDNAAVGAEDVGIFQNLDPENDQPMPELQRKEQKVYARMKRIQYVMDDLVEIPILGINRRMGIDPIIGLIPFVGDASSALVSLTLVAGAAPVLSRYTVIRMLINVWIDAVVGLVPLVGDLFDFGWKANARNVAIFEDHMKVGAQKKKDADRAFVIGVVIAFLLICLFSALIVLSLLVLLILFLTGNLN
jgi:hypothetical protein